MGITNATSGGSGGGGVNQVQIQSMIDSSIQAQNNNNIIIDFSLQLIYTITVAQLKLINNITCINLQNNQNNILIIPQSNTSGLDGFVLNIFNNDDITIENVKIRTTEPTDNDYIGTLLIEHSKGIYMELTPKNSYVLDDNADFKLSSTKLQYLNNAINVIN